MRYLYLMRHGEAELRPTVPDHERSLTDEGRIGAHQSALALLNHLQDTKIHLFVSTSQRTRETAEILASVMGTAVASMEYITLLYHADSKRLIQFIKESLPPRKDCLILAHNMGLSDCARELSQTSLTIMEPATLYGLSFPIEEWSLITEASATLVFNFSPH